MMTRDIICSKYSVLWWIDTNMDDVVNAPHIEQVEYLGRDVTDAIWTVTMIFGGTSDACFYLTF